eukprot:TRINITY_DN28032_c0_g1_i1.p1 TRINITY_DN28032_c0_g1~~TRINITY_DN28032_c0_g1_i1.p1  ORF type:complete len:141 (-),score=46.29 TRINITY_DN28032_c0_g1_i1:34-456(-)
MGCIGIALAQYFRNTSELRVYAADDRSNVAASVPEKADEDDLEGRLLDVQAPREQMYMIGYRNTVLGGCILLLVVLTSISWVLLYLVVVIDYYWDCELKDMDSFCFFGSYPVFGSHARNASVAFFWVGTSPLWFLGVVLF